MPTDSFTQQYTPDDYKMFGQLPQDQQRQFGLELLKQKYWNNMGVDYRPGYEHMNDSQTQGDRARAANQGAPDILALQHAQGEMEKNLNGPYQNRISMDHTPQPISFNPMAAALQGQQDPAMSGLFGVPQPKLQQMAGDVIEPNPHAFGPNVFTQDWWNRVSQPGGYANPAVAAPLAQGYTSGKIKVLRPEGK